MMRTSRRGPFTPRCAVVALLLVLLLLGCALHTGLQAWLLGHLSPGGTALGPTPPHHSPKHAHAAPRFPRGSYVLLRSSSRIRDLLAGSDAIQWDPSYNDYGGATGRVASVDTEDMTYEVDFGSSVAWVTEGCIRKAVSGPADTTGGRPAHGGRKQRPRGHNGGGEAPPKRSADSGSGLPPPAGRRGAAMPRRGRGADGGEGGGRFTLTPVSLEECFGGGGTLCDVAIRIAGTDTWLAAVTADAAAEGHAAGGVQEEAGHPPGTLTSARSERILQLEKGTAKAYRQTPYTLRSRFGSYFAIAGADGKAAFDRMEARSFEHFGVLPGSRSADETSGSSSSNSLDSASGHPTVQLFTQCSPPVCPAAVQRYIAYDASTPTVYGSSTQGDAVPLEIFRVGSCGKHCDASYLAESRRMKPDPAALEAGGKQLLLFATVKPKDRWGPDDGRNINRALSVWRSLPATLAYVFSEDAATRKEVKKHAGIHAPGKNLMRMVPFNHNKILVPTYKSLFLSALSASSGESEGGPVIGYTNGDILYTSSLPATVAAVKGWLDSIGAAERFMIVGRRFNYVVQDDLDLETDDWESKVESLKGRQWQEDAIDYFIVSRSIWDWEGIPDMVVGGTAFDNWVLQHALTSQGVYVIDATYTITAVHQTNPGESLFESHRSAMSDYNHNLGEKAGGWAKGKVTQAPYITLVHEGKVVIHKRGSVAEQ